MMHYKARPFELKNEKPLPAFMPGWYIFYSDESRIQNNLGFLKWVRMGNLSKTFFSLIVLVYLKINQTGATKLQFKNLILTNSCHPKIWFLYLIHLHMVHKYELFFSKPSGTLLLCFMQLSMSYFSTSFVRIFQSRICTM